MRYMLQYSQKMRTLLINRVRMVGVGARFTVDVVDRSIHELVLHTSS